MRLRRPTRTFLASFAIAIVFGIGIRAGTSSAANYEILAYAHCDEAASSDVGVSSLEASDANPDGGTGPESESYEASVAGGGGLSAAAQSSGVPPFSPCSNRAVARIVETLKLPTSPFPNGPVTVTVGMTSALEALSDGGSLARASAGVQLEPFGINCIATENTDTGLGGSCSDGSVQGLSVTRTFSLVELGAQQWEIDVAAQVDATLLDFQPGGSSIVNAAGGLYVMVGGGGVASYTWTGTDTNIPTPEPGATLLSAVAFAALAAERRRRR